MNGSNRRPKRGRARQSTRAEAQAETDAYRRVLADRLRESREPAKPFIVPRMSPEEYEAAIREQQRNREKDAILKREERRARTRLVDLLAQRSLFATSEGCK